MLMHNALAINFSDVFKSSFLNSVTSFSYLDCLIALALGFGIGLFIYLIYKKTFSGVIYSSSFNASLVAMTMITTLVILGVTSNVVLSLGMVGALSIVRFRSAIKSPIDIVFIFWAISEGILCGAGLWPLALIGAAVVGLLLLAFAAKTDYTSPYLLIVKLGERTSEDKVASLLKKSVVSCRVKSKTVMGGKSMELIYEVRLRDNNTDFVSKVSTIESVTYATLVSYDGNYTA